MEYAPLDLIATALGIGGLAFGLLEYHRAQRWKKSEFAAGLILQLTTNEDLSLCCTFLDWKTRSIAVPEKYKVFTNERRFKHTWEQLEKALRPENEDSVFEFPQVLYRDVFDQFLSYLDRIDHYLNIQLFKVEDVEPLRYWIQELQNPRYLDSEGRTTDQNPILTFIKSYHYHSVEHLMLKFALNPQRGSHLSAF